MQNPDFAANAAHELRTPITIIRGFAEMLQDNPALPTETVREFAEKIVRTSLRLENLVKSLLTLADAENVSFQSVDLFAIAKHCKELALTRYPTAEIALEKSDTLVPILGDPQLLDLCITNLLENAVRYSPPPAQIALSIQNADSKLHLIVEDKGIGIPEEAIAHIFDRFYAVDKTRSRKAGGAGLGLSIVKTIVEKHGGTVSVSSKLGSGSAFTISIPYHLDN